MKKVHIVLFASFIFSACGTQLKNYNSSGKSQELTSEKIVIEVVDAPSGEVKNAAGILPSVISGFIGTGIDITKTILDNREQSFTAQYGSTLTHTPMLRNSNFVPDKLFVRRLTSETSADPVYVASNISFKFVLDPDNSVFRIKLDTLVLNQAKARIKNSGKFGKTVDINIDIKIVAQYKDPASASGTKAGDTGAADKPAVVSNGFTIKSTTLGESNITISGITPDGKAHIYGNDDNFTFSDWYQLIPDGVNPADKLKRGVYTITVTVKEANPYAVNAAKINKFFKDNGSDISGLLKAFIPGSSDSGGSSKK